jgi:hypothetical protein
MVGAAASLRLPATVATGQPPPLAWRLQGALYGRSAAPAAPPSARSPSLSPLI